MSVFHEILQQYWGYSSFRPLQLDIIESVASGKDTLGLMPTGGGKSLTFQVPALAKEGICIVVTPLVALMKDQVDRLCSMRIRAVCIHSGLSQDDIVTVLDNCLYGHYKFLYVSPERLSTPLFLQRILSLPVNYLVVDEAHCISQWGYDFRPSYLKIAEIRQMLPEVPVLAVTATATPEVVDDIQQRLHFSAPNVFRMSFERKNLAYVVRQTEDKEKMLVKMLESVPGTAIIYVRMRSKTKEISEMLHKYGISSDFYHAGLSEEVKNARQQAWQKDQCRVIVSTNAFGMGIDKPDVRLVVHYDLPDSPEAYFQEAGRAGRDGKKAYAVLLFQKADGTRLKKRISDTFPDKEYIRHIYDCLCYYYELAPGEGEGQTFLLDQDDFSHTYHLNSIQVFNALKILQQAGYLELNEDEDGSSRVCLTMSRDALYDLEMDDSEEVLLQVLLRSYSGLFSDPVRIQEEVVAKRLGVSMEAVYQGLKRLDHLGVLDYIPRRKTPYVRFVSGRLMGKELHLSDEVYKERKRRYMERIEAMVSYASDDAVCRSKRLMHYFGQNKARNCGQCDVCLRKNERGLRHFEVENIREAVTQRLSLGPESLENLIDGLPYEPSKSIETLRYLCETAYLRQENFKYRLNTEENNE